MNLCHPSPTSGQIVELKINRLSGSIKHFDRNIENRPVSNSTMSKWQTKRGTKEKEKWQTKYKRNKTKSKSEKVGGGE